MSEATAKAFHDRTECPKCKYDGHPKDGQYCRKCGMSWAGTLDEMLLDAHRDIAQLRAIKELVARQAKDDGLWFVAETAPEGHLQEALRTLHAAVEAAGGNHDS